MDEPKQFPEDLWPHAEGLIRAVQELGAGRAIDTLIAAALAIAVVNRWPLAMFQAHAVRSAEHTYDGLSPWIRPEERPICARCGEEPSECSCEKDTEEVH
jgi:hypothetical protein